MSFIWLATIIVHHPLLILIGISVVSTTCLLTPFTLRRLPNFSDPQSGFETRGTSISNRIGTWKNLLAATRESGELISNPKEFLERLQIDNLLKRKKKIIKKKPIYATTKMYVDGNTTDPNADNWRELKRLIAMVGVTKDEGHKFFERFQKERFFCGAPSEEYAHVVLKSETGDDLFTYDSMMSLCRIEFELTEPMNYRDLCVETSPNNPSRCCRPWSLPNYVALLRNRPTCLAITEDDVVEVKMLLRNCSVYYHELNLTSDCAEMNNCVAPVECIENNAVYNIFNFLTSTSFLPPNRTFDMKLEETIIYIPLAQTTGILPYFHELEKKTLSYGGNKIVAMEFGLKNALFDEYLLKDAWLMTCSGLFIFSCMWLYTESLFLTFMTLIAVIFSLGVSYFMYIIVLRIDFFPFMNLLAIVVAIGMGADDAFVFSKVWQTVKKGKDLCLIITMTDALEHAMLSMIVTSLTTAAAFLVSFLNPIIAIRCFSVFASISIMANCLLMVTWFPASVVVWEQYLLPRYGRITSVILEYLQQCCCRAHLIIRCSMWNGRDNIVDSIIRFRNFFFVVLSLVAIASGVVVFYYPKLQLPTSSSFQLFGTSHLFEAYELQYKHLFWFAKNERTEIYARLPLRFVWGVIPQDNGNYLEPQDLGTLEYDATFDITHPDSQAWLLQFCRNVRKQKFYKSMVGPMLPNCFVESFKSWMDRRCIDAIDNSDRSPCCKTHKFPFKSNVFGRCIVYATGDLHETPAMFFTPGAQGLRFSKEKNPVIKSLVVEYDSVYLYSTSYEYVNEFVTLVEKWFEKELSTAPPTMLGGWFISELEFFDVQRVLSESTYVAVGLSMILALVVLMFATLNIVVSCFAICNITCSILVTMSILVLIGWKLNILESVAISTSIGLTVDYSLHYTVNYRKAPLALSKDRKAATRFALNNMITPISMAALTTGMAGAFMMPSMVLAYIQIGIFLVTVTTVSWIYSTFHLGAMLAIMGPENQFGQFKMSRLWFRKVRHAASSTSENHELEELKPDIPCTSISAASPNDLSPSGTSRITVILTDGN